MAVVVHLVVGELELVEGDDLLHPLGPGGRAVGMDVYPRWGHWIGFARDHPAGTEVEDVKGEHQSFVGEINKCYE